MFATAEHLAAPAPLPDGVLASHAEWSDLGTGHVRVVAPVVLDGDYLGAAYLESDLGLFQAREVRDGLVIVVGLGGGLALAFLLALWLQRAVSAPILDLTKITRAVERDRRYGLRATPAGGDEIGELVRAFNDMLSEIEQRDERLRAHQRDLEFTVATRTTELRQANADLVAARDRAMDASRAKSDFLANMSHEIRTPMNGIIGMTDIVLDSPLSADQRDSLDAVKTSAASLLTILNDILDFSKVESGRLELESVPFALGETMAHILKPFSATASAKGLMLTLAVDDQIPPYVIGDPVRWRQIVSNLLGNALKFTGTGGVTVSLDPAPAGEGRIGLHLRVTDTGIGIPPEKHAAIFEPFSQADGSTTRRFGGTGLGLSISMRLVALMGGRLWLDSAEGCGSTFHVLVEMGRSSVASRLVTAPSTPARVVAMPARPLHVLLAEDNLVNQRVAVRLLDKRGHRVTVVDNGQAAVNAVIAGGIDVVLMDVQMPIMGGFEATAQIREYEREHGGHLRIVAMTAHALKGDRERCLAAGMDGYVAKPIDRAALLEAVEPSATFERPPAAAPPVNPRVYDRDAARQRFGGDDRLVAEVARLFITDYPRQLREIDLAIAGHDAARLAAAAHELKGAASSVSAVAVSESARELEILGRNDALEGAPAAYERLQLEIHQLLAVFDRDLPEATICAS